MHPAPQAEPTRAVTRAVIYVAPHARDDQQLATVAMQRARDRGYEPYALLRNWRHVEEMLATGLASVVVYGSPVDNATEVTTDLTAVRRNQRRHDAAGSRSTRRRVTSGVTHYREGYADGYVDCLTIMGRTGGPETDSPISPL